MSLGEPAVHPTVKVVEVIFATTKFVGFKQVGGGPHVIFATHPVAVTTESLRNLKVKQPSGEVDVILGKALPVNVPQYPPAKPPGTLPGPLVLGSKGADIEFPLNTYNASQVASVANEVKVTVTTSPAFVGQIVVVESVELA